jgi:hypothetical protein
MTGIIATMCILLTQIKATYRDEAQPRLRQSQAAGCESTLVNIDIRRMTQWSRWLERLVSRRGRQRAGTRGADASDAAVLGRDCFEHVLCEPYTRAPAGAN